MDTSIEENTASNISPERSSNLAQVIIDKIRSVFGFFTMSKEEMDQAGIDQGDYSVSHSQNSPDIQSDSPVTQNNRRVV